MIRLLAAPLACAALALAPAVAGAHIQVRPTEAAPGDPVLWTVLVPSEDDAGTRQVELAVPKDVLPFSFGDEPEWKRTLRMNPDGTIKSIVWRGETRGDRLATFRFLASTPEQEGDISWAAIQTYKDGKVVRWIGDPDSENPASVTSISASAPRENAGGEAEPAEAADPEPEAEPAPAAPAADEDESDSLARWIAIVAALLAVLAVGLTLRRRRTA